jgi:hypothetical protein
MTPPPPHDENYTQREIKVTRVVVKTTLSVTQQATDFFL